LPGGTLPIMVIKKPVIVMTGFFYVQKLLTHKDPKMTQRYAHLRDEAVMRLN